MADTDKTPENAISNKQTIEIKRIEAMAASVGTVESEEELWLIVSQSQEKPWLIVVPALTCHGGPARRRIGLARGSR